MNKVNVVLLVFALSICNRQNNYDRFSQEEFFIGDNSVIKEDEIYKKNISENGIEDVYSNNYGNLLNLFGRDTIGVVDDEDPDIGVVEDPDLPQSPIDSYQMILFIMGLGYILFRKYNHKNIA